MHTHAQACTHTWPTSSCSMLFLQSEPFLFVTTTSRSHTLQTNKHLHYIITGLQHRYCNISTFQIQNQGKYRFWFCTYRAPVMFSHPYHVIHIRKNRHCINNILKYQKNKPRIEIKSTRRTNIQPHIFIFHISKFQRKHTKKRSINC